MYHLPVCPFLGSVLGAPLETISSFIYKVSVSSGIFVASDERLAFASNYYGTVGGHALDIGTRAKALTEGNYFKVINLVIHIHTLLIWLYQAVTTPVTNDNTGAAYVPISDTNLSACATYIGRNCVVNTSYVLPPDSSPLPEFDMLTPIQIELWEHFPC